MSIALTIILGYFGILVFFTLLTLWAYKRYVKKNKPISSPEPPHYPHTIPPTEMGMALCSVDVIIVDANMMFIGFYDHDKADWITIHDTQQPEKPFIWMYKPETFHT